MTLAFHSGFESGNFFEWDSVTGSPSIQSTTKKTGAYAMRCNTSAATAYVVQKTSGGTPGFTVYLYIASAPNTDTTIVGGILDANSAWTIQLTPDRKLKLYHANVLQASGTTQLAPNTWYRISGSLYSGTPSYARVWVNGNLEMEVTTTDIDAWGEFIAVGNYECRVGIVTAATADLYFDDFAALLYTSPSDPGDIRTLLSLPNASGNYTQFDTVVPSGATHYTVVDDPPGSINDSDYVQQAASATTNDSYGIQDASVIGIGASDTIVAVCTYIRGKRGSGGATSQTFQIIVRDNGADYYTPDLSKFPFTTSFAWVGDTTIYRRYDAVMPNGGAAWTQARFNAFEVGPRHGDTGAQDMYCSAVMIMVAYIPAVGVIETITAKSFPMEYLATPVKAQELKSQVSGATISHVAKDFPETLIKSGKASELRSKWS